VTQLIIDIGDAPNDGTGDPVRDAFNKCNNNFTELYAADAAGGGAATTTSVPPQGRLTLQTGTPVMTSTQAAKTMIYWTPYCGDQIPLYSGSAMVMTTFTELSVATTDTTKSPAAIGASKCNDWFVWSDAGTLRLGHGPDWTPDTARSAGTALTRVNGIWLNNAAITNGPAASRGTYVGTTRSNASSQLDWIYGGLAAGGTAGLFGIWNAYNRVRVATLVSDSTASWSTNTITARQPNGNANMRVSAVLGLQEDAIDARYYIRALVSSVGSFSANTGVGIDSTTAYTGDVAITQTFSHASGGNSTTQLGFHYWAALEGSGGVSSTFFSNSSNALGGLQWMGWM